MDTLLQAHERLLKDTTLQVRFPAPSPDLTTPPQGGSFTIGPGAFWVVVAIVVAVLLAVAVQAVRSRGLPALRLPARDEPAEAPAMAAFVVPASVLADADALARAGAYGDAVHALLLRGVGAIRERFPRALIPAHTSRDIAALAVLPPALAQAFAAIAAQSERAVFAQVPLGREEWEACRALYAGMLGRPVPSGTPP